VGPSTGAAARVPGIEMLLRVTSRSTAVGFQLWRARIVEQNPG